MSGSLEEGEMHWEPKLPVNVSRAFSSLSETFTTGSFLYKREKMLMFYLTLAISHLYFLLTALTELEELNVDRTVITDEGCTVLPSKLLFHHF